MAGAAGVGSAAASVVIKLDVNGDKTAALKLQAVEDRLFALNLAGETLNKQLDTNGTSMKNYAEGMRDVGTEMDRVSKSYASHGASMKTFAEGLKATSKELVDLDNNKMPALGRRLEELTPKMQLFNTEFERMAGESEKLKTSIGEANDEFRKMGGIVKSLDKAHLQPLNKELKKKRDDFDALTASAKDLDKQLDRNSRTVGHMDKSLKRMDRDKDGPFAKMFRPALKFIKMFGIEFLAMSGIVGGFKGVLWLGELATKGWQMALQGLGAAAGVAVAGLAAALGAVRELSVAKLSPVFEAAGQNKLGPTNISSQVSGVLGDRELAMFEQGTLQSILGDAARAGKVGDTELRVLLRTLGNFAIVAKDPNTALQQLVTTFMDAGKEGKVTEDMFTDISKASPDMVKGFEEMYGGAEGLKSALKSGKVSTAEFMAAFNSGTIKSLLPFQDALNGVNDTLIGRFKGSLTVIKEQLTEMGMPLVDMLKGPLAIFEDEMKLFLMRVGPTVERVFGQVFDGFGAEGSGFQRFMESMARLTVEGMPKLVGLIGRIRDAFRGIGGWFGKAGDYMERLSTSWDSLYNNIFKPIGIELGKTFTFAMEQFNDVVGDNTGVATSFADRIEDIFDGVRTLIEGFSILKKAMAPIIDTFLRLLQIIGDVLTVLGPFGGALGAFGLTGMMMGRGGKAGAGGRKGKLGMMGGLMSLATFPFSMARQRVGGGPASPMPTRPQALAAAGRHFFGGGVKPFAKTAGPMIAAAGASIIGGMISSKSDPTNEARQGLGAALSGAAGGAAMGAMVGGVPGAIAGGLIGGTLGFFSGRSGAREAREKRDREALDSFYEQQMALIEPNNYRSLELSRKAIEQNITKLTPYDNTRARFGFSDKIMQDRYSQSPDSAVGARLFQALLRPLEDERKGVGGADELSAASQEILRIINNDDVRDPLDLMDSRQIDMNETFFSEKGSREQQVAAVQELLDSTKLNLSSQTRSVLSEFMDTADYLTTTETMFPGLATGTTGAQHIEEANKALLEVDKRTKFFGGNLGLLASATGKTTEAVEDLALAAGIDLSESLLSVRDAMKLMGYGSDEMANRAVAAGRIMQDALAQVNEDKRYQDARARLEAAGKYFTDTEHATQLDAEVAAGDVAGIALESYLLDYERGLLEFRDIPVLMLEDMYQGANELEQAYGKDDPRLAAWNKVYQGAIDSLDISDLSNRLNKDGAFATQFETFVSGLIGDQVGEDGKGTIFDAKNNVLPNITQQVQTFLRNQGINLDGEGVALFIETALEGEFANQKQEFSNATQEAIDGLMGALSNIVVTVEGRVDLLGENGQIVASAGIAPSSTRPGGPLSNDGQARLEYQQSRTGQLDLDGDGFPGDTATSRLGRTLGRHTMFDAKVPGTRQVTSSLRNFNLGSNMSDHATGSAYDLTGDNLGQYANMVNSEGGFAEFHGAAGGRHLHVVPPQGDTATPVDVGGGGSQVVHNYNMTVNARDSQTAKEVAKIVMSELATAQRTARERR